MKKRLLALALCLVMATSLLPITAAADDPVPIISGLEYGKTYCGEVQFSVSVNGERGTLSVKYYSYNPYTTVDLTADANGKYSLPAGIGQVSVESSNTIILDDNYPHSFSTGLRVTVNNGHTWGVGTPAGNGKHTHSCTVDGCGASETVSCSDTDGDHLCDDCGGIVSAHTWQFTQTDSTLTATCQSCNTPPVTLSLTAHSVTLPDSPFNAQLAGKESFQAAFPSAVIGDLVYKYKGSDGWSVVAPTAANAKAGEYQVGVRITIPSNNPGDNINSQNQNQIYDLYVKYTAADPAITAQTGDNRPIELMLASAAVFSALAAAAFVIDSKRRAQQ